MDLDVVYASTLKDYPDILTPDETAEALGVSIKSVYRLLHNSMIRHIKIGRIYKIPKIHLLHYLQLFDQGTTIA